MGYSDQMPTLTQNFEFAAKSRIHEIDIRELSHQVGLARGLLADVSGRLPGRHFAVGRVPAAAVEQTPVLRASN